MSRTPGQASALDQLGAIERIDPSAVEVLAVDDPDDDGGRIRVELSLDCRGIEHRHGGLELRDREAFHILVDSAFPFEYPSVFVTHARWAGKPHVQWGVSLCLYAAPSVEWQPGDGMLGFIDRLWLWLNKAAAGELDPDDAPLHPPVAYPSGLDDVPMIIPREDTPTVTDAPWIGGVELEKVTNARIDLVGWKASIASSLEGAAPAILLPSTLDFEYPLTIAALLDALAARGVPRERAMAVLKVAALGLEEDEPLIVVLGTAMRGTTADRRQHLAAWYVEPLYAWGLAHALHSDAADPELRDSARRVEEIIGKWADTAKIHWCPVREDRPEVTRRRDTGSPLRSFAGKTVTVWGCGALGAPIAEWLARAGARKLILYDNASVAPGILVRQPFTDAEIGRNKARVVAKHLTAIRPRDLEVEVRSRNVLRTALEREDWHDGADVVIDATASLAVATKLERVRRMHPQEAEIVSMIVGHTAHHALAAVVPPGYSGAGADVMRQVKLACGRRRELRGFVAEFWPDPARTRIFQPEPGCSDPTFTGSGAEVAALAATMLARVAADLAGAARGAGERGEGKGECGIRARDAVGHLVTIAPEHRGLREARLTFPPAHVVPDAGHDTEVRLANTAHVAMASWIVRSAREAGPRTETGGLLFGERDAAAGVTWVDEVIGPPPDSRSSPDEFICGTQGVGRHEEEKQRRGLEYLGMWHTHPTQDPLFSRRDLAGMQRLLDAASSPLSHGLLLIVGHTLPGLPELGAFVFERSELDRPDVSTIWIAPPTELVAAPEPGGTIGLALSGGGSRAMAFHLGCLRALDDRGILERVRVISSVSGGSLVAALWAYGDDDFETFDARVETLLRRGLQRQIIQRALLSPRTPQQLATRVVAGGAASAARAGRRAAWLAGRSAPIDPPLRRWVSRTDAFADVLEREICGYRRIDAARRPGLDVVINACDLRTGSAFRFGSQESGCWRVGKVPGNDVALASAIAASAAYPLLLPALDRRWTFERRNGTRHKERVVLTDGGVFDNLGTSCLEPGRSRAHSYNVFPVDYIIACDAGRGLLGPVVPYGWLPRVQRSFESTFRKLQDGGRGRLHELAASGRLRGFLMPYLGQQDDELPVAPTDLVARDAVADYPTDFRAMSRETLAKLSLRGEQLTRILLDAYMPEL